MFPFGNQHRAKNGKLIITKHTHAHPPTDTQLRDCCMGQKRGQNTDVGRMLFVSDWGKAIGTV